MSNQTLPSTGNKDLIDIIRCHLLHEFTKHGQDRERRDRRNQEKRLPEYCDPWWWPLHPATELEQWGLLPTDKEIELKFRSLRPKQPGRRTVYQSFLGSLGANPGCVFIIGERPSFTESYGQYMGKLNLRLNLLSKFPELGEFSPAASEFHVTDCIKFRGTYLQDKLSQEMRDISRRCLTAEFDLLKPRMVLLTCMAEEEVLQCPNPRRHLQHSKCVVVPHWSKGYEWVTGVRDALTTT